MADTSELLNFVTKFSNLRHSGKRAHLTFECVAGEVIVNLQLHLGPQVLHSHHGPAPQPQVFRKISPSRLRRRARRAQARAMATAENASVSSLPKSDAAVQACESTPARSEAAVQAVVTKRN